MVEAARTPFGRFGGKLRKFSAIELGALAAKGLLARAGIRPEELSETIFGCGIIDASTAVPARQINFKVGIPGTTPSLTVDRACCSSMTAIGLSALKIRVGETGIVLAGGIESCSQTPFLMRGTRWGRKLGDFSVEDPMQVRRDASAAPFTVDEVRLCISYRGNRLELSRYEFRLLKILVERPGRVYSRQELMDLAWEAPDHSLDRTVDAHIKMLRAKLRQVDPDVDPIRTHRGLGYSLREDW